MRRASVDHSRRTLLCAGAVLVAAPWMVRAGPAKAMRLVSIGGALTEIVFALGAEGELVGVDSTSLHPPAATRLPSVGYLRALSSEGILALAPTRIIATEDAGPPAVLRQINAAGIPLTILDANHRFEGVVERVLRLGELLERAAPAAALASQLKSDWQRARSPIVARTGAPLRVLYVHSFRPDQVMISGQDTAAQAMLEYAGAQNAVSGFTGYKPITPEAVVAAAPDVVLCTEQGLQAIGGIDGVMKLPGIERTPAGSKRRIVALEAMFMLGFGPRLPDALIALDGALTRAMRT